MNPQSPQEALAEELYNSETCWIIDGDDKKEVLDIITKHFPPSVEDKGEDEVVRSYWRMLDVEETGSLQVEMEAAFKAGITYVRQQTQLNKVRAQFRASSETGRQYGNQALNKKKGVDEPVKKNRDCDSPLAQPALPQAEKQPETCQTGDDLDVDNHIEICIDDYNGMVDLIKCLQSSNAELRKVVGECEDALEHCSTHTLHADEPDGKDCITCRLIDGALAAIAKVKEKE